MVRKNREQVTLSEEATRLLGQLPELKDLPILPNEQIEEVVSQVRKRLQQRVGQAKAEAWRKEYEKIQTTKRVPVGSGIEGTLTIAGKETEDLGFFDLLVDGRKFSCGEQDRETLEAYLASVLDETVDVTFLHSGRFELEPVKRGRGRKIEVKETEKSKSTAVDYNCTVKVPKHLALSALDDKRMRLEELARILADSIASQWREEQSLNKQTTCLSEQDDSSR